jgi:chromosomal replication initiator protein
MEKKATKNHEDIWASCLKIIKDNIPAQIYITYFEHIRSVSLENNVLTLKVKDYFYYEYLEQNFIDLIRFAIKAILGEGGRLQYSIVMDPRDDLQVKAQSVNRSAVKNPSIEVPATAKKSNVDPWVRVGLPTKTRIQSNLNPYYTFENFIEGECNVLARRAGMSIAANPGTSAFNPLFLYSDTGLGKTHLMHAIGIMVKENFPQKNVLYTNWDDFTQQYIDASNDKGSLTDFNNFYQSIDVLLIDDIHRVSGRIKTQEAFFHIFNHLHNNNKQIVISSDQKPADMEGLEQRLLSRFKWGLSAELSFPDVNTREQILKKKIKDNGILDIEEDVIKYIAHSVTTNIREIEGLLSSILAKSILCDDNKVITLNMARSIIDNYVVNSAKEVSIDYIKNVVFDYFGLPIESIYSSSRRREIVQARQITMYFAKKYSNCSLQSIGFQCGNKDHATVLYACKTVSNLTETDKKIIKYLDDIEKKIKL